MTRLRVCLVALFGLFCGLAVGLPGLAAAATAPASMNLSAVPGTVSWPSQTEFEYRLEVTAGPEGADFELTPSLAGWGLTGVDGSPWVITGEAKLNGPGSLERGPVLAVDPSPTACMRGGFQSTRESWRLTVPPGESTTVTIPARLTGARLAGMNSELEVNVTDPPTGPSAKAPLKIEGPEGVRIEIEANRRKVKSFQRITLTGSTTPALPNRWVQVWAEPRLWRGKGKPPPTQVILSVKTDKDGRFTSRPVYLPHAATWVLTSKLMKPESYDGASSCNGAVVATDGWYRPSWVDLKGHSYVSTKIKGRNLGVRKYVRRDGSVRHVKKNRLTLGFSMSPRFSFNIPHMEDWPLVPSVSPNVGCNRMGGEVSVKNGRIKTDGGFFSTAMLCMPNNDGWIVNLLNKGLKAKMKNRVMVLSRGNTKIFLKRRF